jgi:YVTN family beta-propeller protein
VAENRNHDLLIFFRLGIIMRLFSRTALVLLVSCLSARADEQERLQVGVQPDGRIVVPTNQILSPAGKQVPFPGRPVDLALMDNGRTLVVKNMRSLVFLDAVTGQNKQRLYLPRKEDGEDLGFSAVGLFVDGSNVYVTDARNKIRVAQPGEDGSYAWDEEIKLPAPKVNGAAYPTGLASRGDRSLWVASSRGNCVHRVNLEAGKVEETIAVGVAPYQICAFSPDRLYVTNWGGDLPANGVAQSLTSGSPVQVDQRINVANQGSVSELSKVDGHWQHRKSVAVGLHPSGMVLSQPSRQFLYVANANSDTVSVIDTRTDKVVETIPCRPEARLPFGSGSNALALSPDSATLYVANGTNNCLAVIRLGKAARENGNAERASRLAGLIPTGWYPGAVLLSPDGKRLYVANVKGHGTLSPRRSDAKGKNSHDHLGTVSIIDVPDEAQLARCTAQVNANNRLAYSLNGLEAPDSKTQPVPIPRRHGEPSLIKHVIYIIKENRTYDQVFGDMKEGNGDPNLVMFGVDVTPNHHALAREFTLFDNFYCSGVLSADGHSWTDAAYVTDYLEKAFGSFTRSYPDDGKDALAFPITGFLWDNVLAHHRTLRNYGEFVAEENYVPEGTKWRDLYNESKKGNRKIKLTPHTTMAQLKPYTHPTYPYFPLVAPDAYRADVFLEEWREFERKGTLPDLIYMSLPCDHTEGTRPEYPTPRAMVADNDLALGRIVEAVSHSRFWKDTCIFVVEDDPQNGFDHVDGHRTVALAISPYTRRHFVDHNNYNQTGMVKTIEMVLGLPPMTQMDLSATPMRVCFQDTPDLTPYRVKQNLIALDEMNPPVKQLTGKARYWAEKSLALNLDEADKADEDTLNRILWHATRGYNTPYPEQYVTKGVSRVQDRD